MKKLLLVSALVLAGAGLASAVNINAPTTNGYPARVEYGGVQMSSSAFSAALTTVTVAYSTAAAAIRGQRVVYGVIFSSGLCGNYDSVSVWDSSTALNAHQLATTPTLKFYNVNGSTSTSTGLSSTCSGFSGTPYPVRFSKGLFFQPSRAAYNSIQLLYNKNSD